MAQLPGASVAQRLEATYRSEVTRELEGEVATLRASAVESVRTIDRLVAIIDRQQARIAHLEAENAALRGKDR